MTQMLQHHHIPNLRYEGEAIWEMEPMRSEYMALPAIAVQGKELAKNAYENIPAFGFRLSNKIDRQWLLFFPSFKHDSDTYLQLPDRVTIYCQPDELEGKYKLLKTAINETNAAYQTERSAVIDAIAALNAQTIQAARLSEEEKKNAQHRLDSLQL